MSPIVSNRMKAGQNSNFGLPAGMICIIVGMISNQTPTARYLSVYFITHRSELLTCKNEFLPLLKSSPEGQIFTLLCTPIFIVAIHVTPRVNWEMVTYNFTDCNRSRTNRCRVKRGIALIENG